MDFTHMQHIPLGSAYLCPDCNCIGNCASQCPACASPVLMALASVLNREPRREFVVSCTNTQRTNTSRHSGRRAFLVAGKLKAVRSRTPAPTPITIKAGARSTHAPWRAAQRDIDDGVIGLGEGAAS